MKGRERNSEFMPGAIKSAGGPVSKGAMTSTLHNLGEVTSRKTLRVGVVNPLKNYVLHDIISNITVRVDHLPHNYSGNVRTTTYLIISDKRGLNS